VVSITARRTVWTLVIGIVLALGATTTIEIQQSAVASLSVPPSGPSQRTSSPLPSAIKSLGGLPPFPSPWKSPSGMAAPAVKPILGSPAPPPPPSPVATPAGQP
jgi:hypothetical protein